MTDPSALVNTGLIDVTSLATVILASGSPRRRELLAGLGVSFQVIPPTADEADCDVSGLPPIEMVKRLAEYKGQSVATLYPNELVIAADTLVAIDGHVLGKPGSPEEAAQMLTQLQGRQHQVVSAIAVFYQGKCVVDALATDVWMRAFSPEAIERYVATGEPLDKAGAYAIQDVGSLLVERIEGCYFNVVGMSLVLLAHVLERLGLRLIL